MRLHLPSWSGLRWRAGYSSVYAKLSQCVRHLPERFLKASVVHGILAMITWLKGEYWGGVLAWSKPKSYTSPWSGLCLLIAILFGSALAHADRIGLERDLGARRSRTNISHSPRHASRRDRTSRYSNRKRNHWRVPYLGTIVAPPAPPDATATQAAYRVLSHPFSSQRLDLLMQSEQTRWFLSGRPTQDQWHCHG